MSKPQSGAASQPAPWRQTNHDDNIPPRKRGPSFDGFPAVGAVPLSNLTGLWFKAFLGITIGLYVLNQKHFLPLPLSRVVSKAVFWPTLPITVGRRIGKWKTIVDETVVMGGAPFGFAGLPEELYYDYGVRGVVNFCEEYQGPVAAYRRLGIQQLRLPTADHFEPSLADLQTCVRFIRRHQAQGQRVYVHCRAGHGRSAAGVLAWLLAQDAQGADLHTWNERLSAKRNVRQSLWKQPNMRRFYDNLRKEEGDTGNDEDWK